MNDRSLIQVRILDNEDNYVFGTAYLLNENIAITSRHVVTELQAVSFHFFDGMVIEKSDLVYENEEFDVALVTFDVGAEIWPVSIPRVEVAKVDSHDKWHGTGYPKLAVEGGCRARLELKGECNHCPEDAVYFDIDCDRIPKFPEWGGVSGAPVLIGDRLAGIISKFDNAQQNTIFSASAIYNLYSTDDRFRQYFLENTPLKRLKIS